jgi:hypothetical protein
VRKHGRLIVISAVLVALLATPIALGAGDGRPLHGGARNPSSNATQEYARETEIVANNGTYGTRQSNKSDSGGGAIYGCRSKPGGTPANNEPCIRANNLADGLAFEYETNGALGGTIKVAKAGDAAKPFTTNATGVATGLNADRVDGRSADEIAKDTLTAAQALSPFALVTPAGTATAAQTRGVVANGVSRSATGNYDVVFTGDIAACPLRATVIGTAPGVVTVTPALAADKQTTTVDVRTFDMDGTPADHGFHLSATC